MKATLTALLALSFVVGVAADAGAKPKKKKRYYSAPSAQNYEKRYYHDGQSMRDDDYAGYYEHRLDKVPFGSRLWWKVYEENLPRN
jgi:hypothetical protein